jgi:hypothetical protein
MTQDTFPFAEGEEQHAFADEAAGNRKAIFVAGGVVAALVLGAGGWLLLGGGGDSAEDAAFVPHRAARPAAAAPKAAAKAVKKLPAPYTQRLGRDPFKALYVIPAAAPAAAEAPAAGTTDTTTGTSTSTPTGSTTTGSTTWTPTSRYPLKLVSIQKVDQVYVSTWLVDGKKTSVLPGQRFGKVGELVVLAFGKNAKGVVDNVFMQVGDDSPINVNVGESVSVL